MTGGTCLNPTSSDLAPRAKLDLEIDHLVGVIGSTPTVFTRKVGAREIIVISCAAKRLACSQLARLLANTLKPVLPDNIMGYIRGRGEAQAFVRVFSERRQGRFIVAADIHSFFPSIDIKRLAALLRQHGVDRRVLIARFQRDGRSFVCRGLPMGLATSPILASLYLKPIVEQLSSEGWRFLFFADNFFGFANSRVEGEAILLRLAQAFHEHSYRSRQLKLSAKAGKEAVIFGPGDEFAALGAVLSRNGVLPNPKNSATYYGQKLRATEGMYVGS